MCNVGYIIKPTFLLVILSASAFLDPYSAEQICGNVGDKLTCFQSLCTPVADSSPLEPQFSEDYYYIVGTGSVKHIY